MNLVITDRDKITSDLKHYYVSLKKFLKDKNDDRLSTLEGDFFESLMTQKVWSQKQQEAIYKSLLPFKKDLSQIYLQYDLIIPPNLIVDNTSFHIDFIGKNFYVADQRKEIIELLKGITGLNLKDGDRHHTIPFSSAIPLKNRCADRQLILSTKAYQVICKAIDTVKLSMALNTDYEPTTNIVSKKTGYKLRDFQKVAPHYCRTRKKVLIADEMGTGKTIETISIIHEMDVFPCLLVVPSSLVYNWKNEWEDWVNVNKGDVKVVVLDKKSKFEEADVYITTYGNLRNYTQMDIKKEMTKKQKEKLKDKLILLEQEVILNQLPTYEIRKIKMEMEDIKNKIDAKYIKERTNLAHGVDYKDIVKSIVADECHLLKSTDSQAYKLFKNVADGVEYALLLSGTPIKNKMYEYMAHFNLLGYMDYFGGDIWFKLHYCNFKRNEFYKKGGKRGFSLEYQEPKDDYEKKVFVDRMIEFNMVIRTLGYLARSKEQVLPQLPEMTRKIVNLEMDVNSMEEYNEAKNDILEYLRKYNDYDEDKLKSLEGFEDLVKLEPLSQITAKAKLPYVYEYIDNSLESGSKLIIFAHHSNIIDELKMKYPQFPYITGKINKEQRQKAVEQFQNDPETRGIICSISAAGVGLTLTEADHEIFVEMPWTPAETDQCEARAHRMGQKNNVLVSYLLADKSLDVAKFNLVEKKRQIMKFSSGKFENVNTISVFDVIKMLDDESSEEVI
jgi:SWI/SNF-related matrix-associated actin-dependent regulator 1 of chromatin subfamily A